MGPRATQPAQRGLAGSVVGEVGAPDTQLEKIEEMAINVTLRNDRPSALQADNDNSITELRRLPRAGPIR